jgi:ADP-heptose:LPS heptosyltransferase
MFVGHDSGPMHLAAAVGIPLVAIYSARALPRMWYPRGHKYQIIRHKTDCEDCKLEICIEQKKKCILSITVDEVMQAVTTSIKNYHPALLG